MSLPLSKTGSVGAKRTLPGGDLPSRHCHDLHDGLIKALTEADQRHPAVTHAAQHDACRVEGHTESHRDIGPSYRHADNGKVGADGHTMQKPTIADTPTSPRLTGALISSSFSTQQ